MNPCEDQERAVKSLSSRVELIHGPPGTGKSTTIFHVLSARMPAGATKPWMLDMLVSWNHGNDMNDLPMTPGFFSLELKASCNNSLQPIHLLLLDVRISGWSWNPFFCFNAPFFLLKLNSPLLYSSTIPNLFCGILWWNPQILLLTTSTLCCLTPAFNRSMFQIRYLVRPGAASVVTCVTNQAIDAVSEKLAITHEVLLPFFGPFWWEKQISKHWAISPRNSQKHRDFLKSRGEERQNWDLSKTMVIFLWFRTSTPFQSNGWAWFRHFFFLKLPSQSEKKQVVNARRPTACGSWCWAIRAVWARRLGGILWRICVCAIHWWWLGEKPLNTPSQSALNFAAFALLYSWILFLHTSKSPHSMTLYG